MQRAKEIFDNYAGSKFQMMRDDIITEYQKYNVSPKLEKHWLEELVELEFNKLDINDFNSFFPLWYIIEYHSLVNRIKDVRDFIVSNVNKSQSKDNLNLFIDKVISILSDPANSDFYTLNDELSDFKKLRCESNPNIA